MPITRVTMEAFKTLPVSNQTGQDIIRALPYFMKDFL